MGDVELLQDVIRIRDNTGWDNATKWVVKSDKKGRTALHIATINANLTMVRFIANAIHSATKDMELRKYYINLRDKKGRTPLFFSSAYGFQNITQFLIQRGASIDARTNGYHAAPGSTPLMAAAEKGHTGCFILLMDNDANLMAKRTDGADALYLATREGREDIVKMIANTDKIKILCRDIINRPTYRGRTAIFTAAFHGHLEIGKFLFDLGAKIDLQDRDNFTPLILAAHEGHLDFVKWLVNEDVALYKRDKFGETAIEACEINGHIETMEYFTALTAVENKFHRDFKRMSVIPREYKFKKLCQVHYDDLQKMADLNRIITIWKSISTR